MKAKMTFQTRTGGLLVTVLLAAGLFSGCENRYEASSSDAAVMNHKPVARMYRIPERDKGYQYIVIDTCGGVYFVETNAWMPARRLR